LAEEIKLQFGDKNVEVEYQPSEFTGIFDVYLDNDLVYSKIKQTGRLPHPGEVEKILSERFMK
jgi:predicted Rdx family selenoprotein